MTGHGRRIAGFFSVGIYHLDRLRHVLGVDDFVLRPTDDVASSLSCVIGWGHKANTASVDDYARRHGLPFLRLEDGFLRSVELATPELAPLSIVVDDRGIYYDATRPSKLECILEGSCPDDGPSLSSLESRAQRCIDFIVEHRLSKYNHAPELDLGPRVQKRVLVVDQTFGDMSVTLGELHADGFEGMLAAAQAEHPDAEIIIKTHPQVVAGRKPGYLVRAFDQPNVRLVSEAANPIHLLQQVDHVYVATSQLGFEALLAGKPVTCFGSPFYAGWGLTDDRVSMPRRTRKRSLAELFAAAYIRYPRYLCPETGGLCEIEDVLEHLALQVHRHQRQRGTVVCVGFEPARREEARALLYAPGNRVLFARTTEQAERALEDAEQARLVVSEKKCSPALEALAVRKAVPLLRARNIFSELTGVAHDSVSGLSLAVDELGNYDDPRMPSELEHILNRAHFPEELVRRGVAMLRLLTKADLSGGTSLELKRITDQGQRVVLVAGEAEDDGCLELGARDVRTNLELLQRVRAACPNDLLLFRPHPRVTRGLASGYLPDETARRYCDHIVTFSTLSECLKVTNEVHTITSTLGFEALLRGMHVVTYGQPFYSSWGLTQDRHPIERRKRQLTIAELVAGVLILYPTYVSRKSGYFSGPELSLLGFAGPDAHFSCAAESPFFVRFARKLSVALRDALRAS